MDTLFSLIPWWSYLSQCFIYIILFFWFKLKYTQYYSLNYNNIDNDLHPYKRVSLVSSMKNNNFTHKWLFFSRNDGVFNKLQWYYGAMVHLLVQRISGSYPIWCVTCFNPRATHLNRSHCCTLQHRWTPIIVILIITYEQSLCAYCGKILYLIGTEKNNKQALTKQLKCQID